jgi:hypothetical protein
MLTSFNPYIFIRNYVQSMFYRRGSRIWYGNTMEYTVVTFLELSSSSSSSSTTTTTTTTTVSD